MLNDKSPLDDFDQIYEKEELRINKIVRKHTIQWWTFIAMGLGVLFSVFILTKG